MSLQGKVVLITGASQGIGKATALRVAADGASVVFSYSTFPESANEIVQTIGADRALAMEADADKMEDNDRLIQAAVDKFGKIDVVYANAGSNPIYDLESTTPEAFDDAIQLLVKGPYFLAQKAVPHMPQGGRIIFSTTGVTSYSAVTANYLLYAACKGAIEQMTRVMAKDLGRKGINVNAVGPGPVATEFFYKGKTPEMIDGYKKASPLGRLGEPDDIAAVVAFLSGKDSSWVSGQCLLANGAMIV